MKFAYTITIDTATGLLFVGCWERVKVCVCDFADWNHDEKIAGGPGGAMLCLRYYLDNIRTFLVFFRNLLTRA